MKITDIIQMDNNTETILIRKRVNPIYLSSLNARIQVTQVEWVKGQQKTYLIVVIGLLMSKIFN